MDVEQNERSGGVSRGAAIVGMIITFVGGFFFGQIALDGRPDPAAERAAKAERTEVKVGLSPVKGPADALVTVVEFADFECGFCARSVALQKQMMGEFPGRIRWVFKHFPLQSHPAAELAAVASLAAQQQGAFWDYHDLLFANRKQLSRKDLIAYAARLGLDTAAFEKALDSEALKKVVEADKALAQSLGVNGTPTFFINGRKHVGSFSYRRLRALIREELAFAGTLLDQGVRPEEIYQKLLQGGAASDSDKAGSKSAVRVRQPRQKVARAAAETGALYRIPAAGGTAWGEAGVPVTMVLFSDYQCPNSAHLYSALRRAQKRLGEQALRVVFKHFPMPSHKQARLAAEAALAAGDQGKFWAYSDLLFAHQQDLSRGALLELAGRLELDTDRFADDLTSRRHAEQVTRDMELAMEFGCIGTPSYFVNGRHGRGELSDAALEELLEAEAARGRQALEQGITPEKLYEHLTREGKSSV